MKTLRLAALGALLGAPAALPLHAQLGRQFGLVEPNVAADSQFARIGLTAPTIAALKAARPILSVASLDTVLRKAGLTAAQRTAMMPKMFVHVDLNRGSDAELALVPGLTKPALAELKKGRPWPTLEKFAEAMMTHAKVSAEDVVLLQQYFFIPLELNTFTAVTANTFAPVGVGTSQWKREFAEYRPWKSMDQFRREIGKYVRGNPRELERLQRYVYIKGIK